MKDLEDEVDQLKRKKRELQQELTVYKTRLDQEKERRERELQEKEAKIEELKSVVREQAYMMSELRNNFQSQLNSIIGQQSNEESS